MDWSTAVVTVSVVLPDFTPEVAVTVAEPAATPVARPAAFTVATDVVLDDQITDPVMSCELPLLRLPVAVNCWVNPATIDGFAGVTAIDWSAAAVTVVLPETVPDVAVIVEMPAETPVAIPLASTVTIAVADEVHCADAVISCVVPSENVPVAVNCWVSPTAMLESAGVTLMDCKAAFVTVNVAVPVRAPDAAVIFAVPAVKPLASPEAFTVATVAVSEDHVTDAVISCVVPSA
jgi:hypothetical protein